MVSYLLRRLAQTIPILVIVSVGVFLMVHVLPGDPVDALVGQDASPEDIAMAREQYGLDRPLWEQYVAWLGGFATGDFGFSYATGRSVATMITGSLPVTLTLATMALAVCLMVGVPAAVVAAFNKGKALDKAILGGSLLGISMPSFVLGVMLMLVFSVTLRWFPSSGYRDIFADPVDGLRSLALPAVSLGLMYAANIARIGRAATLEVLSMDYVDMAKASGIGYWSLRFKHILRNALIPILTVVGVTLGGLLGGAVVTEQVFNLSGVGTLIINAITRRDYPVIQATVLLVAVIYLLINLLVDLLYALIDPKVRYATR